MERRNLFFAIAIIFLMTGCASFGNMPHDTGTQVLLKSNNYKMIKAGAKGESSGFYFLGIIPFASPSYGEAKAALYQSIGKNLEGKSVALANQTQDKSLMYLILFSIPKLTITADVIEFIDEPDPEKNSDSN